MMGSHDYHVGGYQLMSTLALPTVDVGPGLVMACNQAVMEVAWW